MKVSPFFRSLPLSALTVATLAIASTACTGETAGQEPQNLFPTGPKCQTPWENPTEPSTLPEVEEHPELTQVPEGLTLVGANGDSSEGLSFDCNKPTAIYIHGNNNKGRVETFPHANLWAPQWNVMVFRWHREAYEPNSLSSSAWFDVETASERLIADISKLKNTMGLGYKKEIRLIAHGIGSALAINAAEASLGLSLGEPARLDLLDPVMFQNDFRELKGKNKLVGHAKKLAGVRMMGVKVISFTTTISRFFIRDQRLLVNTQEISSSWAGQSRLEHPEMIKDYYFESITQSLPQLRKPGTPTERKAANLPGGFSAAFPSDKIPNRVLLKQVGGNDTVIVTDDVYEEDVPQGYCSELLGGPLVKTCL